MHGNIYMLDMMNHLSIGTFLAITSELGCYLGVLVSLIIVFNLMKMKKLSFINKMFLVFFMIDALLGSLEIYFLFNLNEAR